MIRPSKATICGVNFHILPFDPFHQLELFGDLQREILPHVGGVLSAALAKSGEGEQAEADERAAIQAFRDLSNNFSGAVLKKWADLLIDPEYVSFDDPNNPRGEPAKLSAVNRGLALPDFAAVLELMYHVGRVNFAGPLARWGALTGLAQKAQAYLSASSPSRSSLSS